VDVGDAREAGRRLVVVEECEDGVAAARAVAGRVVEAREELGVLRVARADLGGVVGAEERVVDGRALAARRRGLRVEPPERAQQRAEPAWAAKG
jgi:hypothetical protein